MKFKEKELDAVLTRVQEALEMNVHCYLIGGLAMIKHRTKMVTKDVDIVFDDVAMASEFMRSAEKTGFRQVEDPRVEYEELLTSAILVNEENYRFDIFVGVVCGALIYTQSMKDRTTQVQYGDKLQLNLSSPEDIFLFKAITSRPNDLLDMSVLVPRKIDWSIIETEVRGQPESWKWVGRLYGRLRELYDEFGVRSPLLTSFKEDAEIAQAVGILIQSKEDINPATASKILKEKDPEFISKVMGKYNTLAP